MNNKFRVVVAPNALKGSLNAIEAAKAIAKGVAAAAGECDVVLAPVSDGGDGLTEVMQCTLDGSLLQCEVEDPLRRPVQAEYCYVPAKRLAVIEMARASGLNLIVDAESDPTRTTSLGTGQLVRAALDAGAEKILVGLGGSATCDGGLGAAAALGVRFLDKAGLPLEPVGGNLVSVASIDMGNLDNRLVAKEIIGLCDVTNPLTGPRGASQVYSPQKGANEKQVAQLDEGLENLAHVLEKERGLQVSGVVGAGAAGGLGAGLIAFMGGTLRSGIEVVFEKVDLAGKLKGADLVITAEGQMDEQTCYEKAPVGVARLAKVEGIPCIGLCGSVGDGMEKLRAVGMEVAITICRGPHSLEYAMENGFDLLAHQAEQVVRLFLAGRKGSQN